MRISDWSSDVCSSDLLHAPCPQSSGWRVELRGEPYYVYRWQTSKGVGCYASRRTDQSLRFQGGHEPRCLSTEDRPHITRDDREDYPTARSPDHHSPTTCYTDRKSVV